MINLFVSAVLLCCIVLCAFMCNKGKRDESANTSIKSEQPQQGSIRDQAGQESPRKVLEKQKASKKKADTNPAAGPYNALAEENLESEPNPPQKEEETKGAQEQQRAAELKYNRRIANIRKSRLLSLSVSKPFVVDDSNDDFAIPHDSVQKVPTQASPLVTISTKRSHNSPLIGPKSDYIGSRVITQGGSDQIESRVLNTNTGLTDRELITTKADRKSPFYSTHRSDYQLGLFGKRQKSSETYQVSESNFGPKEDLAHETNKKRDGYRSDTSVSGESDDHKEWEDDSCCDLCSLNKKDCVNKPCGHKVACYACMEQFKKSYGVCPQCKKYLTNIEKVAAKEKKMSKIAK